MQDEEAVSTTYQLADNVYAHANINCQAQVVYLWLGANVMLEYSYEEAQALLNKNLAVGERSAPAKCASAVQRTSTAPLGHHPAGRSLRCSLRGGSKP